MPRVVDRRNRISNDKDPLRGLLDYQNIEQAAEAAGLDIGEFLGNLQSFAEAVLATFNGDLGAIPAWIAEQTEEIREQFADWAMSLTVDWDQLVPALKGEYEGANPALLFIQALFAPLRKLIEVATGAVNGIGATATQMQRFWDNLQDYVQGIDITVDPSGFFTGIGGVAQSLMDVLFGGLSGSVSASGVTVAQVAIAATTIENRVTALEGGGVQMVFGASDTIDLTEHPITGTTWSPSEVKVWMWRAGTFITGGTFAARTFSVAHLESLGVPLDAVVVTVGSTGGGHSKFASYGSGEWAIETSGSSYYVNGDGIFTTVAAGVAGGDGGTGGQGRVGADVTVSGVPVTRPASSGSAGQSTQLATGGAGGAMVSSSHGADGGHGESIIDFENRAFAGGAGGGGGGGAQIDAPTAKNGGKGGNGGWPGGGAGEGGEGSEWWILGVKVSSGSDGAWGGIGAGGVVVEIR